MLAELRWDDWNFAAFNGVLRALFEEITPRGPGTADEILSWIETVICKCLSASRWRSWCWVRASKPALDTKHPREHGALLEFLRWN